MAPIICFGFGVNILGRPVREPVRFLERPESNLAPASSWHPTRATSSARQRWFEDRSSVQSDLTFFSILRTALRLTWPEDAMGQGSYAADHRA